MNLYQLMWNDRGYGARYRRVMGTHADGERKRCALMRVWHRMSGEAQ